MTLQTGLTDAVLANPPASARPGFRWWWAAPLDAAEAVREVRAISAVGFSEVEIAFSAEAWATQEQREVLRDVLEVASEVGTTVSMTMGASWPVSTPNTGEGSGLSALELQYGRADLEAGRSWSGPPPPPFDEEVLGRPRDLVAVTVARVLEDGTKPELLPEDERPRWGSPVRPMARSTVLDPVSMTVLTDASAEHVAFTPPDEDHWVLLAFWSRESAGHHAGLYDGAAARAVAAYLDEHQLGAEAAPLVDRTSGDFFEDSLEVNAVSVSWTPHLLEVFRHRRGYDLTALLPLVVVHGMCGYWVPESEPVPDFDLPGGRGEPVRRDYERLLTDLYVDEHLAVLQGWAEDHSRSFKAQVAYGLDLEPVRSARALAALGGRVETESLNSGDRAPVRSSHPTWRFALDHQRSLVSGVHQAGRTRISTELGAQFLATYELTLADYAEMMAKEWAVGVTRPFVHGFAYVPPGTPWPGKQRFGDFTSESWNDLHFPQWEDWPALTAHWARGTLVLETGKPLADVAFVRDGFLTSTARGFAAPDQEGSSPHRLVDAEALEQAGYVVQLVDSVLLEELAERGPGLVTDGVGYRALVVEQRAMSPRALEGLVAVARAGVHVVIVGDAPDRSSTRAPGGREVRDLVEELLGLPGTSRVEVSADVAGALAKAEVVPRVRTSGAHLLVQVREDVDALRALLYNPADHDVWTEVSLEGSGVPTHLDLWSGERREAGQWTAADSRTVVPVEVGARSCAVVELVRGPVPLHVSGSGDDVVRRRDDELVLRVRGPGTRDLVLSDGRPVRVVARGPVHERASVGPWSWTLEVRTCGPEGTDREVDLELPTLSDWRSLGELATEAGVGTYRGVLEIPADWVGPGRGAELDLGRLGGSARVRLNGRTIGTVIGTGCRLDVSDCLHPGGNDLEVEVRTVLRNAVTHHCRTSTRTSEVGLLGPVRLTPYADHPVVTLDQGAT